MKSKRRAVFEGDYRERRRRWEWVSEEVGEVTTKI